MGSPLWKPSEESVMDANITRFRNFVNKEFSVNLESYDQLYKWSVDNIPDFWASVWKFVGIIASREHDRIVEEASRFPGTRWFVGARLNFAENLLRYKDDQLALIYNNENGKRSSLTYSELSDKVMRLAESLRKIGIVRGDRVAAYMPNKLETIIAMLASTSIGAIWSSCGIELGPVAVLDRIEQIKPKVLFSVDGYSYKGKNFFTLENIENIANGIPSLEKVLIVSNTGTGSISLSKIRNGLSFDEFISESPSSFTFEQLPFDHPVYIMFSSGTTGKPKSLVQSAGGVLINHLKELIIHSDLRRNDKITYLTSPSWMMWNWLVSSLGVGATIFIYDGDPNYPNWQEIWKHIQSEEISIFGCSASYINNLRTLRVEPRKYFDLSKLRQISQTGSPLSADGFKWVYRAVKKDLHLNSISGGTDINGCFAIGNPTIPVHAGEIQAFGLGMKISAYDIEGNSVLDKQGELVCEAPSPSMPLYFWNDLDGQQYLDAYFAFYRNANKNVWRHGDYILIHGDTHGITFYGRSDAVLKPSGVRIGTAEIYNIVEKIPGIKDSLAVGQNWNGDQRVILFVQLSSGEILTEKLKELIKQSLRKGASPRHSPALIFQVPDIPYTFNGKKVEIAVANLVSGRPVSNKDSLIDPAVLDYYESLLPEILRDAP